MPAKPLFAFCLVAALAAVVEAQSPIPPRPSPPITVEQTVGFSKIKVSHGRPGVKGRQIFGGLVPWGEVWRTGADEATIFEISHDALVDGKKLPAGKYAFFTIPRQDGWTLIWNREADQWGAYDYKAEADVLRLEAKARAIPHVERFTIGFAEVDERKAKVELRWAELAVPFEVAFDTDTIATGEARAFMEKAGKEDLPSVMAWSYWAYNNGVALAEAEGWMAKAAAENDRYRIHALHARILAKNGKGAEAKAAAEKALARAAADPENAGVQEDAAKLKQESAAWQ
jgi:hypothetical protein